jgi:hypothetical protein
VVLFVCLFVCFAVLGIKPKTSPILSKDCSTELYPWPLWWESICLALSSTPSTAKKKKKSKTIPDILCYLDFPHLTKIQPCTESFVCFVFYPKEAYVVGQEVSSWEKSLILGSQGFFLREENSTCRWFVEVKWRAATRHISTAPSWLGFKYVLLLPWSLYYRHPFAFLPGCLSHSLPLIFHPTASHSLEVSSFFPAPPQAGPSFPSSLCP